MLVITVLGEESFDEEKSEFVYPDSVEVELEHSLVVLSKWEQKYEKPFLGPDTKTPDEQVDYVRLMIASCGGDPNLIYSFSEENFQQVGAYMNAKMTATWFNDPPGPKKSSETITAELVYYWMQSFRVDLEFENRHLNQLFTIIKTHSLKNQPPKKMGKSEALRQQRELNARRQAELGSRG